ncbi:MAG: sulfurtransferase [Deltaproteobacteria bacterium]|nr:MAG: sulfurtransferase [Deltaproteobacteria bacterium]
MKKKVLCGSILMALLAFPLCVDGSPATRAIEPLVSTQWLEDHIDTPNLVILDVRAPDNYAKGHIPGAINVPGLGNFYVNLFCKEVPWMELPEQGALFTTIGNAGITGNSLVVVVGRTVEPYAGYALADAARVAITLLYAGIENVAILNGGYDKWAAEGKTTSTVPVTPTALPYTGVVNKAMFVPKGYVEDKIGKSVIVEAREADVYFGLIQEPWTQRAGHIPSAKCLPSPWLWTFAKDKNGVVTYGTWKDCNVAKEMASAVLGKDASQEIIVYCGVGGYASPLYFVLTQAIGYTNVKIYDGSMQEWSADPKAPVVKYKYE